MQEKTNIAGKAEDGQPTRGQSSSLRTPFTNVGVDCFGPMFVCQGRGTVKRYGVLFTCLKEQPLDDEGLLTLMCEVESVVNGRPNPRDPEALTPNHFLLSRSSPTLPPGLFVGKDKYSL